MIFNENSAPHYDYNKASKSWNDALLQAGWNKDNIGYRLKSNSLKLEEMMEIGESLQ